MVCLDERAADAHVDADTEDVAVVDGVWVRVFDSVGCDAGAGAVDILGVASGLFGDDALGGGGVVCAVVTGTETRGQVGLGEEDGGEVCAVGV